jgi:hypothetical protein
MDEDRVRDVVHHVKVLARKSLAKLRVTPRGASGVERAAGKVQDTGGQAKDTVFEATK